MNKKQATELEQQLMLESGLWFDIAKDYVTTGTFPSDRAQKLLKDTPGLDPTVFRHLVDEWLRLDPNKGWLDEFISPVAEAVPIYQFNDYLTRGLYPPPETMMAINVRLAAHIDYGKYQSLDDALSPTSSQGSANFYDAKQQRTKRARFILDLTAWIYEKGPFENRLVAVEAYVRSSALIRRDRVDQIDIEEPADITEYRYQLLLNELTVSFGGKATTDEQLSTGGIPKEIDMESFVRLLSNTTPVWKGVKRAMNFKSLKEAIRQSTSDQPFRIDNNED